MNMEIAPTHYQRSVLCLGAAFGFTEMWYAVPSPVLDVIHRIRRDEEIPQMELDLSISVLGAILKRNNENKYRQFLGMREEILGRQEPEEDDAPWGDGTIN